LAFASRKICVRLCCVVIGFGLHDLHQNSLWINAWLNACGTRKLICAGDGRSAKGRAQSKHQCKSCVFE
jgi:hypothetical protein